MADAIGLSCLPPCILDPSPPPLRTVLLRHALPDGGWHHDWLIQSPDAQQLRSFRVSVDPLAPGAATFDAIATPDHRPVYLDYEGPISGGRGEVTRVWRLDVLAVFLGRRFVRVQVQESGGQWQLRGRRMDGDLWSFRRRAIRALPALE